MRVSFLWTSSVCNFFTLANTNVAFSAPDARGTREGPHTKCQSILFDYKPNFNGCLGKLMLNQEVSDYMTTQLATLAFFHTYRRTDVRHTSAAKHLLPLLDSFIAMV